MWYDRQGNPIERDEALRLIGDPDARRVALDTVGNMHVSTVFLVLDHGFGQGPPVLFETIVFSGTDNPDDWGADLDMRRYCTEAEALAGHNETVTLIRATEGVEHE